MNRALQENGYPMWGGEHLPPSAGFADSGSLLLLVGPTSLLLLPLPPEPFKLDGKRTQKEPQNERSILEMLRQEV